MTLSGVWTQRWSQRHMTRSLCEVTHGKIPLFRPVLITSYTQDICEDRQRIRETYDLIIDSVPAVWTMHGSIECLPRERSGMYIRTSYEQGCLSLRNYPMTIPFDHCHGYMHAPLDMTYVMNMYEILVLNQAQRIDRDVQQRLCLYNKN